MKYMRKEYGGTVINIITAVVFFGLLAYAIMWLMKSYGQAGEQYAETMVEAKRDTTSVKCQMNLRAIQETRDSHKKLEKLEKLGTVTYF